MEVVEQGGGGKEEAGRGGIRAEKKEGSIGRTVGGGRGIRGVEKQEVDRRRRRRRMKGWRWNRWRRN